MVASRILLTDLYELTMLQAYFDEGLRDTAAFSLFVRRLPERRNYLVACGLDDVLRLLETLAFDEAALAYLDTLGQFSDRFLGYLKTFRFTGDVYAVPEGTPVFSNEPILEVVAPLPEAQVVESIVMNQIHLQTVLASKAARVVAAARGRQVVDFGLRRAHGLDAGLKAARAFHIAGVESTSNVAAGQAYGLRVLGTMAHSYIQAHDSEYEAFRRFALRYPGTTLLIDTYDSLAGVGKVIALAAEMGPAFNVGAIGLDSGDLGKLAVEARRLLDAAGLRQVGIFASGNLNEDEIDRLLSDGAPIVGFGVGTHMAVSQDAPTLDIAYKLVEYGGRGRVKLSSNKEVLPGRKQVFRIEHDGQVERDLLGTVEEALSGRPLIRQVMAGGTLMPEGRKTLAEIRTYALSEVQKLPARLRSLAPATPPFRVDLSDTLARNREALGRPTAAQSSREGRGKQALLIVDAQNDFCAGGALAVPESDRVLAALNRHLVRAKAQGTLVYASRDWHPEVTNHFARYGGRWPLHCVKESVGAEFHPTLELPASTIVISKGEGADQPGYSVFEGQTPDGRTFLVDLLMRGVTHLEVGGLATDYCVRASVLDALSHGFEVTVLSDAIAGVDVKAGDSERAIAEMRAAGAEYS